ncbi:MAG: histidine--tRNA ligase [Patescibacteria group bacterium]
MTAKRTRIQTPTGMHDILPEDQKYYKKIYEVVENVASFYGFGKIDTPILEDTELFYRGIGEETDIVQKEMFNLKTRGGDHLSLRPELTAPVVRAYLQHGMSNLPQPIKLWYFGPCFRYEKPQSGRFRQFQQFGLEVFGEQGSVIDAQIIQIFYNILQELKLKNIIIQINNIGDSQCRPYYKKLLKNYLKSREGSLCADCRSRLKTNPLRVLDCKQEKCQRIIGQAPQAMDHLCENCHQHFKEVLEFLDEVDIPYSLNPHLVRGLDYYTKTVFEIVDDSPGGRSIGSLVGGGRYDALVKTLSSKDIPAIGAASGVERIIGAMKASKISPYEEVPSKVFLAQLGRLAKRKSLKLFEDFRKAKISIVESFGRDSLKAQLVRADKLEVEYTLILGQKEALEGSIIIRNMQNGKQKTVKIESVVEEIKKSLRSKK